MTIHMSGTSHARGTIGRVSIRAMERMRSEHRDMERAIALIEFEVEREAEGEAVDAGRLLRVFRYLAGFADCVHHPREDAAVRRLEQRAPHAADFLSMLEPTHAAIVAAGLRHRAALERIKAAGGVVSPRRIVAIGAYAERLRDHLAYEDAVLFPLLETFLGDDDWRAIDGEVTGALDNLFASEARALQAAS
jgi:hemerythrin-like domain-containing protein